MTTKRKELIWEKFNRWTVISNCDDIIIPWKRKRTIRVVTCRCDCWTIKDVRVSNLSSWISQSCGCRHKEIAKELMDKMRPTQVGSKNPNWRWWNEYQKSRPTYISRRSYSSTQWWRLVKIRDWFKCRRCWNDKDLHSHHILNFSSNEDLRFDINNWITFCKECHSKFHSMFWYYNNDDIQIEEYLTTKYAN